MTAGSILCSFPGLPCLHCAGREGAGLLLGLAAPLPCALLQLEQAWFGVSLGDPRTGLHLLSSPCVLLQFPASSLAFVSCHVSGLFPASASSMAAPVKFGKSHQWSALAEVGACESSALGLHVENMVAGRVVAPKG